MVGCLRGVSRLAMVCYPARTLLLWQLTDCMRVGPQDGSQFFIDAASGGVDSVPERYRAEVKAQIEALQRMAALLAPRH